MVPTVFPSFSRFPSVASILGFDAILKIPIKSQRVQRGINKEDSRERKVRIQWRIG